MTRHTITEDFENRDVTLGKGDVVILLENDRYGEKGYGGDKYSSGLEKAGGYYHVMVKTRHGRKVRIPRHILSKDCVLFHCQLCDVQPMAAYRDYVDHMIDTHLRVQLLRGLDMSKKTPACPFPSCHGISWPIVDNLLFHYASHHNVLEKVVMYESETASTELRQKVKNKDEIINSLVKELELAKKTPSSSTVKDGGGGGGSGSVRSRKDKEAEVQDNLQGAREMRVIMDQMKEEIEGLKGKLTAKNQTIKNLKEDYAEMKKDFREAERKYEQECRYSQTLQTELRLSESSPGQPGGKKSSRPEEERRAGGSHQSNHHQRTRAKDNEDGVSSSGVTSPNTFKSDDQPSQEVTMGDLNKEVTGLKGKVESLQSQIQAMKSQKEALNLENENLKHIIEIGKSTVETAKKISEDIAEENKAFKERDLKQSEGLKSLEVKLGITKTENKANLEKIRRLEDNLKSQSNEISKLKEEKSTKDAEVQKLTSDLSSIRENLKQEENSKHLADIKRDEIKSKLTKCRENVRNTEEAKKTLESDYKVLLTENRNAAAEIKTLKNHLNSSRAIVVEKAVVKDEIAKIKSDLTSKTIELEKTNIRLRKIQQQLNTSSAEMKILQESKSLQDLENKNLKDKIKSMKGQEMKGQESKDVEVKLKVREEEIKSLSLKLKTFEESKRELEERLEFYIQQCSVFEKNDMRHQEEILVLQGSIKSSTMENSEKLEKCQESIKSLESATLFYKQQVLALTEQNELLRSGGSSQAASRVDDKELLQKYTVQCDQMEEMMKKQERLNAQLRRKDWEIENYQRKLDSAFEAGISMTVPSPRDPSPASQPDIKGAVGVDGGFQPGHSSSGGEAVLDLSTKKKSEDTNNNIKTEEGGQETDGCLRARKYSELSECSEAPGPAVAPVLPEVTEETPGVVRSPSQEEVSSNKRGNTSPSSDPPAKKFASGNSEES